ncbi:hypothetical protein [Capnocytophaga catalasegens]|uniref:DNA polymerase III subunit gamma/tau n=1 Tax=Capnocytophaga catalasegens TaxID=1004260 RepID=A0AAV5AUQ4_9FLAO|nr:hypothetical protein [Capnocytophaga catalasegens]GIZ14077.1 hypothetical protein RCZ03_00780 [Capnocytophaga catalasegens]GJM49075.1 hypothetical protein RCZ15_00510 [Capnocytophaga catalasegens]GJM52336.1 hypothetical protein RCZ16_06540 [Capnocytophaga catalasegens]
MKKEAEQIRRNNNANTKELPYEFYTQEQFFEVWQTYIQNLIEKGEKIQAANLTLGHPKVYNNTILIEVASEISKEEIVANQEEILSFVREKLRNYSINLEIEVKASEFKQRYILKPEDKYEKMLAENPLLAELKKVFDLDF